ncbi:hypothetical protein APHCRT_0831, partial [Anaplasma phagocytophilum str. CRT53-1]
MAQKPGLLLDKKCVVMIKGFIYAYLSVPYCSLYAFAFL